MMNRCKKTVTGMEDADSTIFDPDFVVQDGMARPRRVKGAMLGNASNARSPKDVEWTTWPCYA